jgi:predicted AlkP superfamily phosphohydrolase/phosphomutase
VPQGGPLLDKVDWNKTTAYAVGYNSLFINLEGREQKGIVQQKKYSNVVDEIRKKLLGLKNPSDDTSIIKNVYTRVELGINENDEAAPDLIVGYYRGVRGSWSTAVGETPLNEFEKRSTQWSGDHLFDKTEVPGIFFSNIKDSKIKKITDIIPWLMHFYSQ